MSKRKVVHFYAPETPDNKGTNVYCPVKKEFTHLGMGKSADGLETFACRACKEPEPVTQDVSDAVLDVIFALLDTNK